MNGPAKIRPKGVTALLRASQRPEATDAADPTGLQSASDEQSGADRLLEIGFSGARTRLLPLFGLSWLYAKHQRMSLAGPTPRRPPPCGLSGAPHAVGASPLVGAVRLSGSGSWRVADRTSPWRRCRVEHSGLEHARARCDAAVRRLGGGSRRSDVAWAQASLLRQRLGSPGRATSTTLTPVST